MTIAKRKEELEREIKKQSKKEFEFSTPFLKAELKGITFAQAEMLKMIDEVIVNVYLGQFDYDFDGQVDLLEWIKKELKSQLGGEEK